MRDLQKYEGDFWKQRTVNQKMNVRKASDSFEAQSTAITIDYPELQ